MPDVPGPDGQAGCGLYRRPVPAISIDQKTTSHNPRSTVGTVTEIYDYLRLLWARIGVPHCPVCGREISQQTVDQMVDQCSSCRRAPNSRCWLLWCARAARARSRRSWTLPGAAATPACASTATYDLDEEIKLEKNIKHTVEIVVDRLAMQGHPRRRWPIRWRLPLL